MSKAFYVILTEGRVEMEGKSLKFQILGLALMLLGFTMRLAPLSQFPGLVIGVIGTWLGLIFVIVGFISDE